MPLQSPPSHYKALLPVFRSRARLPDQPVRRPNFTFKTNLKRVCLCFAQRVLNLKEQAAAESSPLLLKLDAFAQNQSNN